MCVKRAGKGVSKRKWNVEALPEYEGSWWIGYLGDSGHLGVGSAGKSLIVET